jgi:AAA-like domain
MTAADASFYVTGGTLRQDAPSYVERQADRDLYAGLMAGEFCYVLTSRQMGKSSLMVHTAARLREEGVAVVVLDLTAIGQNLSAEQWYGGLLRRLGRQLDPGGGLEETVEEFWFQREERIGPLERWMAALEQVLLPHVGRRIVIFIDEIDAVRSLPFSTDEFFAAIRECYNRRTQDPAFQRLTFCLLGVASPSDLIQDTRTTPFNIGRRIELTDFTAAEAAPLARGLLPTSPPAPPLQGEGGLSPFTVPEPREPRSAPPSRAGKGVGGLGPHERLLQRILYWTSGHPYLTQRLCQAVATDVSVTDPNGIDRHCLALFLSPQAREQDDNLLFVRERPAGAGKRHKPAPRSPPPRGHRPPGRCSLLPSLSRPARPEPDLRTGLRPGLDHAAHAGCGAATAAGGVSAGPVAGDGALRRDHGGDGWPGAHCGEPGPAGSQRHRQREAAAGAGGGAGADRPPLPLRGADEAGAA